MKEILLDDRKKIALEIIKTIDQICRLYNFDYYLAYGSLIGAIRHKGFIPWDDDIDIWIPSKDYFNFLEVCKRETDYIILQFVDNLEYPNSFCKISDKNSVIIDKYYGSQFEVQRGIAVDVFPLAAFDNLVDIYRFRYAGKMIGIRRNIRKSRLSNTNNREKLGTSLFLKYDLLLHKDELYWNKKYTSLINKKRNGKKMGCPSSIYGVKDVHDATLFKDKIEVPFENIHLFCPSGYNEILSSIYGDYMQLPPPEKRISNHLTRAYILDWD